MVTAEGVAKRLTQEEVRGPKHGKTNVSLKSGDRVMDGPNSVARVIVNQ